MNRFAQILQRIAAVVAEMASAVTRVTQTVMQPVLVSGRWTIQAFTEVALLPVLAMAAMRSGSAGVEPQAEGAVVQTKAQIEATAAQQESAMTVQRTARMVLRAARLRASGQDISELADIIPGGLGVYIRKLNTTECRRVAEMDASVVMSWVSGVRPSLPGIRTRDELVGKPPASKQSKENSYEDKILAKLAERILTSRDQPAAYTPGQRMAA